MNLNRIVYVSERSEALDDDTLRGIVEDSRERNEARGISGLLLVGGSSFIQVLEGDPLHIRTLYNRICADPRHRDVQCVLDQPVDERLFGRWGMKLGTTDPTTAFDRDRLKPVLIRLRLSNDDESRQGALRLLQEFQTQLMNEAA